MCAVRSLVCLACSENERAIHADGRLGPMCKGCQTDYDANTRDEPTRRCAQCHRQMPEFEFKKGEAVAKMCSFCRAEWSERARRAATEDHDGIMDRDIENAYRILWVNYKQGSTNHPGKAIEILEMVGSAEHISGGHYCLTDQGKTTWAYMATKAPGDFDIDPELMQRAHWIMSIKRFLEFLEDGEWKDVPRTTAYATRKEARDAGWVDIKGSTVSRQYRINNEGRVELLSLRAKDGALPAPTGQRKEKAAIVAQVREALAARDDETFNPEHPLAFDGRQSLRESYEMSRASDSQTVDDATEDPEPEGYVETTIEVDWQRIAEERLEDLNHLRDGMEEMRTSRDFNFKVLNDLEGAIDALAQADKSEHRGFEYVKDLRQRLTDALNHEDSDMVEIIAMAIEDNQGDLSPAEYVQQLRDFISDDVAIRLKILDELFVMTPAICRYIQARQMAEANQRAIVKGSAQ